MSISRLFIIVVNALTCVSCATGGHPSITNEENKEIIALLCSMTCNQLTQTCLNNAEYNRNICTDEHCDELHTDEKFECISSNSRCKTNCINQE